MAECIERETLLGKVEAMTPEQFYNLIMEICGAYLRLESTAPVMHGNFTSTGYDELYCEFGNCSVCGGDNPIFNKFCGHCGAKMDGEEKR